MPPKKSYEKLSIKQHKKIKSFGLITEENIKKYKTNKFHQYGTTLGLINVNINNHTDVNSICKNKEFNQNKIEPKPIEDFKFPDKFPASNNIYVIGRIKTIEEADIRNYKNLIYLNLPRNNGYVEWSIEINDLFLLCGYNKSFNKNNCISEFKIMLIVDKKNKFTITNNNINLDSFRNDTDVIDDECKKECILPKLNSNKYDSVNCDDKTVKDKNECYSHLASVTFEEIRLLTTYFNMRCYFLKGYLHKEKYDLYFFYPKECFEKSEMQNRIDIFNRTNPAIQLVPILVKQKSTKQKYLKYKKKYLELKNIAYNLYNNS